MGYLLLARRPGSVRDDAAIAAVTLAAPGRAKDEEACRRDHVDLGEAGSSQRGLEICRLVEDLTDTKG